MDGGSRLPAAVEDVVPLAAEHAAEADRVGRLHPAVVEAVVGAGFARHFVAAKWGGDGGTFTDFTRAVTRLGIGCAAVAWFASLAATLGRMAGYLPADGQRQVWDARGPDTLVVGSLMPAGTAERAADGWRLRGEWPFVSAVEVSDWALLCARTGSGNRVFVLPRAGYSIRPAWTGLGMRATASHTLVVDGARVPSSLTFPAADLYGGTPVDSTAPCHAVPLKAVTGLSFAAPILGAARAAQDAWVELIAERRRTRPLVPLELATYQLELGRASGEIDAAQLLLDRVAATADAGDVGEVLTARASRDCALTAELLDAATDRLLRAAGTSTVSEGHPLERIWRDVRTAASHGSIRFSTTSAAYADLVMHDR